ncbi:MAG: class I SAM-dependent methyltransferase [Polyangiaceae bacterium]
MSTAAPSFDALFGALFTTLDTVYGMEGEALRITEGGLFLATPIDVVAEAIVTLVGRGHFAEGSRILDAGSGDGRIALALASVGRGFRVYGVECDASLHARALSSTSGCNASAMPRLAMGDYFMNDVFHDLGVRFSEVDTFFHYPDGNESRLFERIASEGKPGAMLVLLSPELRNPIAHPLSAEMRIEPRVSPSGVAWFARMYEPARIRART